MSEKTLVDICNTIEAVLGAAAGLQESQSFDELSEGIPRASLPMLQVYPASGTCDAASTTSERTSWGGIRQEGITINADLYAARRTHVASDMKLTTQMIDSIRAELQKQGSPFFGIDEIQGWRWTWERRTFRYAGPQDLYMGARFILTFRLT